MLGLPGHLEKLDVRSRELVKGGNELPGAKLTVSEEADQGAAHNVVQGTFFKTAAVGAKN